MRCVVLVVAALLVAVARAARVDDGLVALYTFEEGQEDESLTASQDQSGRTPSLLGPISFAPTQIGWRPDSIGLEFGGTGTRISAESANNISALVDLIDASKSYTFEAWISMVPSDWERSDDETVVWGLSDYKSFADTPPGEGGVIICPRTFNDTTDTTTPGTQLLVSMSGLIYTQWRTSMCDFALTAYPERSTEINPHHFTLTFGPRSSNPSQFRATTFVDGSLAAFFTYNVALDPTRWPKNKLQFGPPTIIGAGPQTDLWRGSLYQFAVYDRALNATEVAANFAAGIPNSKPFAETRTDTVLEDTSALVTLPGTDFDDDPITVELVLLTLVAGSTTALRYANGTDVPVASGELPLDLDATVTGVVFTPPADFAGAAGSITYRVRDATKTSNNGVVSISVQPVDDPPVATNTSAVAVAEVPTVLTLTGTDVDAGDGPASARIAELPSGGGSLYLFNDSAADKRGARIDAPAVISGLRVVYVSDTLPENASGVGVVATDSFAYFVRDSAGAESASPATFTVSVRNNLFAEDLTASTDEDTTAAITFPYDSSVNGTVSVVVESLPATNGSVLLKPGTTAPLAAADLPYTVPNASATLQYRPAPDLYGDPLDTFTFHAVREGGWRSGSATCRVAVSPVNDPPTATLPRGEDGEVTTLQLVANQAEPTTFTVTIQDPDVDDTPYRVTVNVLAFGAYINLNVAAVDPESIEFRSGDGVEDGLVIFLALRADLNALFDGIELHAAGEANGTVAFLVSDEAAGGVEISFAIPFVASKDPALAAPAGSDLPLALQWSFVVGAALLGVYACYLCCCRGRGGKEGYKETD